MAVGCGAKCSKFLLFVFNVLVFLAGIALFTVGIWVLVDDSASKYFDIINNDQSQDVIRAACIIITVVGAVAAIISFCGCCGACRESKCMLMTYAVVLSIILVIQIAGGITAAVFRNDIGEGLEESMNDTVQNKYGQPHQADLTDTWDFMQVDLKCCGAYGYSDWSTSKWRANQTNVNATVPLTCCVLNNDDPTNPKPVNTERCYRDAIKQRLTTSEYLYTQGCHDSLHEWVKSNADIIIGVAFGLAAILLFGVICACVLGNKGHGDYQYV